MKFEENPQLTVDENEAGRESINDFNEMFNETCNLFTTFKGPAGQRIVSVVVSMIMDTPELQQFLFDFFYNIRVAERVKSIFNEK